MKTQTQTQFNQVNKTTGQAAETPVKGYGNGQQKTFGSVDMWNILRQRKSTTIR